jgi:hypothetical protein
MDKPKRGGARPGAGRKRQNNRTDIRIRKGQEFVLRTYGGAYDNLVLRVENLQAGSDPNIVGFIRLVGQDDFEIALVGIDKE